MSSPAITSLIDLVNDNNDNAVELLFKPSLYYDMNEFSELLRTPNIYSTFSVMNTNARSLCRHINEYKIFMEALFESTSFQFDLISFTETWLDETLEILVNWDNYTPVFKHKPSNKAGGGLCILVKSGINFKIRKDLEVPQLFLNIFDALFIEVDLGPSVKIVVAVCYRSPSNNSELDFTNYLSEICDKVILERKSIILVGDMNIDL